MTPPTRQMRLLADAIALAAKLEEIVGGDLRATCNVSNDAVLAAATAIVLHCEAVEPPPRGEYESEEHFHVRTGR